MADKINGRTPEEIKKTIECRRRWGHSCELNCRACDVFVPGTNGTTMAENALALINQLERERDVAIILLRGECLACLHNEDGESCRTKEVCQRCVYNKDAYGMDLEHNWQWRGAQEVE